MIPFSQGLRMYGFHIMGIYLCSWARAYEILRSILFRFTPCMKKTYTKKTRADAVAKANAAVTHDKKDEKIIVHNLLILDESGSMERIYHPSLSGCNETIQSIRSAQHRFENQDQRLSFVTFNSSGIKTVMDDVPIDEVRDLTPADYHPDACTPLYDAVGKSCAGLEKIVTEKERVLVTIITDGLENASSEYTLGTIQSMTERLRAKGWTFVYMGANQNAKEVALTLNIKNALTFEATAVGTSDMFSRCGRGHQQFYDELEEKGLDMMTYDDMCF